MLYCRICQDIQTKRSVPSFVDGREILIPILDFVFQHGHELDNWHHVTENLGQFFVNDVSLGIPPEQRERKGHFLKQVEQSSDNRCVLENCPRASL